MPSGPRTAHTIACSFSRWIFWAAAARSSAVTTRAASLMRSNSPQSTIVLAPDGSSRRILITRTRHRNENASRHLVRLFLLKIKVHGYHTIFERSVHTAVPILRPSPGAPFLWFGSVVDLLQTFPSHTSVTAPKLVDRRQKVRTHIKWWKSYRSWTPPLCWGYGWSPANIRLLFPKWVIMPILMVLCIQSAWARIIGVKKLGAGTRPFGRGGGRGCGCATKEAQFLATRTCFSFTEGRKFISLPWFCISVSKILLLQLLAIARQELEEVTTRRDMNFARFKRQLKTFLLGS